MPDACEVGADLVHAAGLELDLYEVVAFVVLLDAVMRDGFLRVLAGFADLHLAALRGVGAGERFRNRPLVFFQVALDEREVELFDFVFAYHAREVAERIAVEGGDEHSGSFLVQTVRDSGLEVKTFAAAPFPEVFHQAFAGARARARLACQTRGLVYYHVVFGLQYDIEFLGAPARLFFGRGERFAPGGFFLCETGFCMRSIGFGALLCIVFAHALEILVDAYGIALGEHLVRLADDSVHADFLFADDGEEYGQGFVGECLA